MIRYLDRTRNYYAAQGYTPYRWAHFDDVPWAPTQKPLAQSRVVLVTTAAPFQPELGDQGPGAAYNAAAKFFEVFAKPVEPTPDLRISHIGYDRKHCAADDPNTWLPVAALARAAQVGTVGSVAPELIGLPTNRSQRVTVEQDAPEVLAHCERLQADVVLLVPT